MRIAAIQTLARIAGRFARCRDGATNIEYGLIVALVFLAMLAGVKSVGSQTVSMYSEIQSAMISAGS